MRFVKWLIGLVIIAGVLLALAPYAAKWYLLDWFESKGYQAQIKHLGLDFIFGEVTLYDVDIRNAEGEGFGVFNADFDLDWLPLLEGRVVIDRATIEGAQVDLRKADGGWLVAGFSSSEWGRKFGDERTIEIRAASLANTEVCKDYKARCLRVESARLSGARLDQQPSGWSFLHAGPLTVQKAFLRDQSNNTTLFYGGELNVERGIYSADAIDISVARLQNIQFVENDLGEGIADAPYQTQIGELTLSSLQWQRSDGAISLELGPIEAISVRQAVQKSKEGELLLPARVQDWLKSIRRSMRRDGVTFKLEQLDTRDGALAWADHSVTPAAMEKITAVQLHVGRMDSSRSAVPTPIQLSGKVGSKGRLKFEGELFPYSEASNFFISGIIETLDVGNLAGYTRPLLSQRVDEGIVDVAIDAVAEDGRLRANTRWQWTDFDIEPAREKSPYMPLELSYELLKDHNNSVRFSLEVSGDIGSKTVQPEYVLATQARRMLSNMARGQVGANSAVSVTGNALHNQRLAFEPLYYSINTQYPAKKDQQRIDEIASMLKDKPHLSMTFCPVTTGGEWAELFNRGQAPAADTRPSPEQQQRLRDLAIARGRALRSALIDAGVSANQLVICDARVDMTQFGLSFVSVSL